MENHGILTKNRGSMPGQWHTDTNMIIHHDIMIMNDHCINMISTRLGMCFFHWFMIMYVLYLVNVFEILGISLARDCWTCAMHVSLYDWTHKGMHLPFTARSVGNIQTNTEASRLMPPGIHPVHCKPHIAISDSEQIVRDLLEWSTWMLWGNAFAHKSHNL